MACGVSVIASNRASIPEIVGDCGILLNLKEFETAEVRDEIISRLDGGLDEAAIKRSESFSWRKTALKTLDVYNNLYD
jgi:glycosyltransferase involved in cell wall biosynthesis